MNPLRQEADKRSSPSRNSAAVFFFISVFVLFYHLGGPALFEPDEGRNAEKAREILLIHDWVTPHEDFLPVLDKPVFFYWLVAASYKLFGVSEWSARLPSVLAALGSLVLVYLFAKKFLGPWEALWSGLILLSSIEFFSLSRIVIFDMPLSFFIMFSLCSFYWGTHCAHRSKKRVFYLSMYAAMGGATLIKGPIGLVIPGMVIFCYLALEKKWSLLREMDLAAGAIVFLLITAPWYVWADIRNPGFLRYFLWEENFIRFLTPHFQRHNPWHYFIWVLAVGFLPWTLTLPKIARTRWRRGLDETTLFLALWAVLPFVFFSFSDAKLPHYILPIYPPLSMVVGEGVAHDLEHSSERRGWPLWFPAFNLLLLCVTLIVGVSLMPNLLPSATPKPVREGFGRSSEFVILGMGLGAALLALAAWKRVPSRRFSYVLTCLGFALFVLSLQPVAASVSVTRSSKMLAEKSAALIHPDDQLVVFDTYLASLPFYLHVQRPIWMVWSGAKGHIMGSWYAAEQRPRPEAGYGRVLLTFKEFATQWKGSQKRLLVFVKEKNLARAVAPSRNSARTLLQVHEIVLVTNS